MDQRENWWEVGHILEILFFIQGIWKMLAKLFIPQNYFFVSYNYLLYHLDEWLGNYDALMKSSFFFLMFWPKKNLLQFSASFYLYLFFFFQSSCILYICQILSSFITCFLCKFTNRFPLLNVKKDSHECRACVKSIKCLDKINPNIRMGKWSCVWDLFVCLVSLNRWTNNAFSDITLRYTALHV